MENKKLELCFASDIRSINTIIHKILTFIIQSVPDLSTEEKYDLKLVFSELLCNAIIHGNQNDIQKKVHLLIEIFGSSIKSTISDEGGGFDYNTLLANNIGEHAYLYESENGRGIRLVQALTDGLSYNITGNEIFFYKRVATIHGQNFSS